MFSSSDEQVERRVLRMPRSRGEFFSYGRDGNLSGAALVQ